MTPAFVWARRSRHAERARLSSRRPTQALQEKASNAMRRANESAQTCARLGIYPALHTVITKQNSPT
jgi:hypothetical protein